MKASLRSTWELARDLVLRPERAFERIERPGAALGESVWIYLAFTVAFSLFYSLKPIDFPAHSAEAFDDIAPGGLWYWLGVGVLGTLMTGVWVGLLGTLLQFTVERWLPLAIALQLLWTSATAAALALYLRNQLPAWAFLAVWALLLAPLAYLARARKIPWLQLLSLMLALNVFALVACVPMTVAIGLRSENFYLLSQAAILLWMLGVGTKGIRRFTGLGTPRVFLSLGFSLVASVMVLFSLYGLGLVSEMMLKVYFVP